MIAGAGGLGDEARDQADVAGLVGPFDEGAGGLDLGGVLEVAHLGEGDVGGAADQDHRPAVGLGVAERGDGVGHAGSGDDEGGGEVTAHVGGGLGGVTGGLFVADADEGHVFLHPGDGDGDDGDADESEHFLDALGFEGFGDDLRAGEFSHGGVLLLCIGVGCSG